MSLKIPQAATTGSGPSPIRGQQVPKAAVATGPAEAQSAQKLASSPSPALSADLERYLDAVDKLKSGPASQRGWLTRLTAPEPPRSPAAQAAISAQSQKIQAELADAAKDLLGVFQTGRVTETDVSLVKGAAHRLNGLRAIWDEGALQMLPRDVRARLEQHLFAPMGALAGAAEAHATTVFKEVAVRDFAALDERLTAFEQSGARYQRIRPEGLAASGLDTASAERYRPGDFVLVPRSDGSTTLGVVQHSLDGGLQVAIGEPKGSFGTKFITDAEVRSANPFKIGDVIQWENSALYVTRGADGRMGAWVQDAGNPQFQWVDFAQLQGVANGVNEAARLAPTHPGQKVITSGTVLGGADALETRDFIHRLEAKSAKGGLASFRGPTEAEHGVKYADYNEDAAVLGAMRGRDGKEVVLAAALDQAGGMGKLPDTGAASAIAAKHTAAALTAIAGGTPAPAALEGAARKAHAEIVALNQSHGLNGADQKYQSDAPALTTFAAAAIQDGFAHVAAVGDSKVWHFDKDGRLKNQLLPDNFGDDWVRKNGDVNDPVALGHAHVITSSLGHPQDKDLKLLSNRDAPWKVEPGDYIVVGSDAICDANLQAQKRDVRAGKKWPKWHADVTTDQLGQVVGRSRGAADATEQIRDFAIGKMAAGEGKPDNTTVVVLQAT